MTVARRVAPGREAEFEDWADRLTAAAAGCDGFLGAGLLRPGRLGEDWHVVYRFDSPDHLDTWQRSPARAGLMAEGEAVMRTTGTSVPWAWFAHVRRTGGSRAAGMASAWTPAAVSRLRPAVAAGSSGTLELAGRGPPAPSPVPRRERRSRPDGPGP